MSILLCPVCGLELETDGRTFSCPNRHAFDRAKEGYLNLLLSTQHRSRHPGDAPALAHARRAFLALGHYAPLREFICARVSGDVVLDACCGEGYYTAALPGREVYGFDIAKDMIRLASKADKHTQYFVAGLHAIPVRTAVVDTLVHLFAPFADASFSRVLRRGGILLTVQPGERHLWQLKQTLYETPYLNRETPPETTLRPICTQRLRYDFTLPDTDSILHLFRMTPYSYKTARDGEAKLCALDSLRTTADFVVLTYGKD